MADAHELVLFDLGGVLMRLSGPAEMRALAGLESDEEVWRRWLSCDWVRAFERGRCDADEFAAGVVADWGLPIDGADFVQRFRRWPVGLFDGALELVAEVRATVEVGCLSNSNALHWADQASWGLADAFDHTFLSHEMGLIKPDPDVFRHVADHAGVEPARIVFLDDNRLNVDAAAASGFVAHLVQDPDQARAALVESGVLT